jgi:hypothetical protein
MRYFTGQRIASTTQSNGVVRNLKVLEGWVGDARENIIQSLPTKRFQRLLDDSDRQWGVEAVDITDVLWGNLFEVIDR